MNSSQDQLRRVEALSADHPEWVLRCCGHRADGEPFELVTYRGFSSSVTHSTSADADAPLLEPGGRLESIAVLAAPLAAGKEQTLQPPLPPAQFWRSPLAGFQTSAG